MDAQIIHSSTYSSPITLCGACERSVRERNLPRACGAKAVFAKARRALYLQSGFDPSCRLCNAATQSALREHLESLCNERCARRSVSVSYRVSEYMGDIARFVRKAQRVLCEVGIARRGLDAQSRTRR